MKDPLKRFLDEMDEPGLDSSFEPEIPSDLQEQDPELRRLAQLWKGDSVSWSDHSGAACANVGDIPTQIGRYRVERWLGRGGFGAVFSVREETTGQKFALKWLHRPERAHRESLLREALLLSQLRHPGLIPCSDFGYFEERPYFVMEQVDGESLARRIARLRADHRPVPDTHAMEISRWAFEVAQALAYIHSQGLLHRDLKPGNILIDGSGKARLSDFGLAQRLGAEDCGYLGTLSYMSPEQVRGENLTARSDIFSFGACFYETLTLHKPFVAEGKENIRRAIQEQEVRRPCEWSATIPVAMERIVLRCLEKDPNRRYSNAEELVEDLRALVYGAPSNEPHAGRQKKVSVFCAILAVGMGLYCSIPSEKAESVNPVAAKAEEKTPAVAETPKSYEFFLPNEPTAYGSFSSDENKETAHDNKDVSTTDSQQARKPSQLVTDSEEVSWGNHNNTAKSKASGPAPGNIVSVPSGNQTKQKVQGKSSSESDRKP